MEGRSKNVNRNPNKKKYISKMLVAGVSARTIHMVQKDYYTSFPPRKKISPFFGNPPHHFLQRNKPWYYDTHRSNIQEQS